MNSVSRHAFLGGRALVDGAIRPADVVVDDGLIVDVCDPGRVDAMPSDEMDVLDLEGAIIAPGFIDTQCNGAMGHDITAHPSSIRAVAGELPKWGVTTFLPTVVTSAPESRDAAIAALHQLTEAPTAAGADPVGLHFEGPAISPARLGTHDAAHQALPSATEIERWCASGRVRLVTLAPELPGVEPIIDRLVDAKVVVALGHTDASASETRAALDRGVRGVTHLFNAMPPIGHRDPGPIGIALDDRRAFVGLICDGVHLDPTIVRIAWQLLGAQRAVLVTDGTAATGMPDGDYVIGGTPISVDADAVRNEHGNLAGSSLTMDRAVDNLVEMTGCPLADALTAAAHTPARYVGLDDRGAIEVGRRADFVVLDDEPGVAGQVGARHIAVLATYVKGVCAWKSSS